MQGSRFRPVRLFVLGGVVVLGTVAYAQVPGTIVINPPAPAVSVSPVPTVSPVPLAPLTRSEERSLRYEFQRAQAGERQSLDHRQRAELKDLKASHDARLKEWQNRETGLRREYFKSHNGPEKRAYMRDLQARRKILIQVISEEKASRSREHEARLKAVRDDQRVKLQEFQEALKRHERPDARLWPNGS